MDIRALIDFNKYTLLIAMGSFGYFLEKAVFADPDYIGFFDGLIIASFLISIILGILMYGACVSGLHSDSLEHDHERTISAFGKMHAIFLLLSLVGFAIHIMAGQPVFKNSAPLSDIEYNEARAVTTSEQISNHLPQSCY